MESVILVVHVLVAITMVGLIMLQQGKGAEMGASFGAGASQTVFGAAGSVGFLTKMTAVLAAVFFITSLSLGWYARKNVQGYGVVPEIPAAAQEAAQPAGDVPTAPAQGDVPAAPVK